MPYSFFINNTKTCPNISISILLVDFNVFIVYFGRQFSHIYLETCNFNYMCLILYKSMWCYLI